ncbi:MAG: YihY/virulence factor BrkB family protein [Deltaproteobacteria bacterium]|nr:YihY/virulence factor BrkB family protein [Deltaproteobacteria bacterium]
MNIQKIIVFLRQGLWQIRLNELSRKKSFLIRQLRIVILAFRGFDEDKCALRASALTLYTLLLIVPAAAMAFGVAKGFGLQKLLEKELYAKMQGQEEAVTRIVGFANSMLENTKGGLIAGIGVAILFYLIIKLLGNIEKSFNEIWGIPHPRTLSRKLSDYLAIMLVCPVLLVMSSSITVFITTQITLITQRIDLLGPISPIVLLILKALPYCVIWLLFTFVYIFLPNTKVYIRSGLLGGIVAGTIYELVQWIYINFQIGVSSYGAIYGSFAALPLFMVWLQVSWLIVLFGAEISFAHQNVETYEFEPDSLHVSPSFKRLLALKIAYVCVKTFCNGEKPWSAGQISNALEIPIRLVNQILFELEQCRILSEVNDIDQSEQRYQPARSVDTLSINFVLQAIDSLGSQNIPIARSKELTKISDCLQEFASIANNSEANILLKNI